jgi:Arc/MetJ family transcription regulator
LAEELCSDENRTLDVQDAKSAVEHANSRTVRTRAKQYLFARTTEHAFEHSGKQ